MQSIFPRCNLDQSGMEIERSYEVVTWTISDFGNTCDFYYCDNGNSLRNHADVKRLYKEYDVNLFVKERFSNYFK